MSGDHTQVLSIPETTTTHQISLNEFPETTDHVKTTNHFQALLDDNLVKDASIPKLNALQDRAQAWSEGQKEILRKGFNADSHELAHKIPEDKGAVQKASNTSVRDIGWHKSNAQLPDPLIAGYSNGELFAYIRRFNKDVFDVKAVPMEIARGLDLNDAWSQDHAKDKLTLHLQRVYLTVVLGGASLGKQISRLRSWDEFNRTSAFCLVYFSAWYFNLIVPLLLSTLIVIVSSSEARDTLFPPAPRALVNIKTGLLQTPQAGQLGTDDTLTGAPEKQPYEAIEEEAANFFQNIRHNIQKAVGMHDSDSQDGDPLEGKVPKPVRKTIRNFQAEGAAAGHIGDNTDQTQKPMEELIWKGVNPETIDRMMDVSPHIIGEVADNWERFANALSPRPPFSRLAFLRIDAVLAPLLLASLFINYYVVYKLTGLAIGFLIFGDPILTPAMAMLKEKMPNYIELAQPKNNILRGVPTNNQIAITLLRIGEAHNTPLPPVPSSKASDPDHHNPIDTEAITLNNTDAEILHAVTQPAIPIQPTLSNDNNEDQPKHKHISKIVRLFKSTSKSATEAKLALDHGRAKLGSEKAKGHLGVLPKTSKLIYTGPSEFSCRFQGKHGWAVVTESPDPTLLFTYDDPRPGESEILGAVFALKIRDVVRLKRATAFVSVAIEAAAKFAEDKELLASLEIEDVGGKTWRLTAMPERDELFNRLVAIGEQRWVNM